MLHIPKTDFPAQTSRRQLAGIPKLADRGPESLSLDLAAIPVTEFRDPFFKDTIDRHQSIQIEKAVISRERLIDLARSPFAVAPAGIIFHISRCGSTALSNIIRSTDQCRVFSEPLAVNDLLMPPHDDWSDIEIAGGLRCIAKIFQDNVGDQPWILKLRSWNVLFASGVLSAFPRTPWVFLVRDPLEVAVSVLTKPPTWLRAFPSQSNPFLPFLGPEAPHTSREAYVAMVLCAFVEAIGSLSKRNGLLLHYEEFGPTLWLQVMRHFGLQDNVDVSQTMSREAKLYSKDLCRATPFVSDVPYKQLQVTDALRHAIREFATRPFEQLIRQWRLL